MTNGPRKSDSPIVPTKQSNKADNSAAETVEGRGLAKGNTSQQNTCRTQCRESVPSALERVRQVAKRNKNERFTSLFHHVTVDRLRAAFFALKRKAAAGIDGVTWEQYGENLEDNLQRLHQRLHQGAYRPKPSRRVFIPKTDGRKRALGIASLEDKVVQRAVVEVLNAIYENDFIGFSYGFRPGRNQHQALDALAVGTYWKKVNFVFDGDLRGFFDAIDHGWMLRFIEHRVGDPRVIRLIRKWLKAGVLEEGRKVRVEEGSPQGATISPLLANIYLHYCFDLWAQQWRKRKATGDVIFVRFADDIVAGFQKESDANRFHEDLTFRLRKFSLELNPEKTRLIRFGRYAAQQRAERGQRKPETFEFLGFTHICGEKSNGKFLIMRHTSAKRMRAKLKELKQELMRRRHLPISDQGAWLRSVVIGYFNYHAVPTNINRLMSFRTQLIRNWRHALRRRSQHDRTNWSRMNVISKRWIPPARVLHRWPEERFDVRTQGRSPVR